MAKNLPIWFFLSVALILMGLALYPLVRVGLNIDQAIGTPFLTVVMLLIGGLMSGLSAMILLVRRAPDLALAAPQTAQTKKLGTQFHATGLLMYTGIPLLNFLAAYWLWARYRHQSAELNLIGRDVLNFQITIYLYLLLSLFMVFAAIGIVTTPLVLLLHLVTTLAAIISALRGKHLSYPSNIPIIQGRRAAN